MKTLTTLTAVTALIAGMSIASAQMSQSPSSPGASGSSGSSQQASGSGKYCLETTPGGALDCKYASVSACQRDAKGGQNCAPNPNSGTTGSK